MPAHELSLQAGEALGHQHDAVTCNLTETGGGAMIPWVSSWTVEAGRLCTLDGCGDLIGWCLAR